MSTFLTHAGQTNYSKPHLLLNLQAGRTPPRLLSTCIARPLHALPRTVMLASRRELSPQRTTGARGATMRPKSRCWCRLPRTAPSSSAAALRCSSSPSMGARGAAMRPKSKPPGGTRAPGHAVRVRRRRARDAGGARELACAATPVTEPKSRLWELKAAAMADAQDPDADAQVSTAAPRPPTNCISASVAHGNREYPICKTPWTVLPAVNAPRAPSPAPPSSR
jgi:hypothetical protein